MQILAIINLQDKIIDNFSNVRSQTFEKYFNNSQCDLCHTNHKRKVLYVFEHDGTMFAAGKTCFQKRYPKIRFGDLINRARNQQRIINEDCYDVRQLLAAGIEFVRTNGYDSDYSSKEFKVDCWHYIIKAQSSIDQRDVDRLIEYFTTITPTNDFVLNCKNVCTNQYCSHKVIGLIPALINTYNQSIMRANTKFYGEVGSKVDDSINATIVAIRRVDRQYAIYSQNSVQVFLKDDDGHVFCSWVLPISDDRATRGKVGDRVIIERFTVKSHFNGMYGNTTSILRPKFKLIK